MNKNELISAIADRADLSKSDVGRVIDVLFDVIIQTLKSREEVRLIGFGTFAVTKRAETEGRNPRTGEKIIIPESYQVKFRVGKSLKDSIN